jgi:SlyX protein
MNELITRLEEKIAYLERHVTEQDKVMLEISEEVARLKWELKRMNDRIAGLTASGAAGSSDTGALELPPPHY